MTKNKTINEIRHIVNITAELVWHTILINVLVLAHVINNKYTTQQQSVMNT